MARLDRNGLVQDAQDWLHELRALQAQAIARGDYVQAEELRAEIAVVRASLDGVLDAAAAS